MFRPGPAIRVGFSWPAGSLGQVGKTRPGILHPEGVVGVGGLAIASKGFQVFVRGIPF